MGMNRDFFDVLKKQTGLSLRQIAKVLDTDRSVVQRWAAGEPPSAEVQEYAKLKLKMYCTRQIKLYQEINREIYLES